MRIFLWKNEKIFDNLKYAIFLVTIQAPHVTMAPTRGIRERKFLSKLDKNMVAAVFQDLKKL